MSYCNYCEGLDEDNPHKIYHDSLYGFPLENDDELFGRLILEINQAGLSWNTILKKQRAFRRAFANFSIEKVASFQEEDVRRLLKDASIIRNKMKINAVIHNAGVILNLQSQFGSFADWLNHHHPLSHGQWVKLFKKHFKFTGNEITKEFLMSSSYLPGAHDRDCPIHALILDLSPKWNEI